MPTRHALRQLLLLRLHASLQLLLLRLHVSRQLLSPMYASGMHAHTLAPAAFVRWLVPALRSTDPMPASCQHRR